MATYTYKALGKNGDLDTGEITAADRPEALKVLGRRGLQPVKLSLNTASGSSREEKKSQSSTSSSKVGSGASKGRRDDGPGEDQSADRTRDQRAQRRRSRS